MENNDYVVNHNVAFASIGWRIDGTGDFDGDGDADILWRHRDGMVVTWEMEDGEFVMYHSIARVASTWQIDGTGDFDVDGDADILWRHRDGDVVTWEMENGAYVVNHNIGPRRDRLAHPGNLRTSTATAMPTSCGATTTARWRPGTWRTALRCRPRISASCRTPGRSREPASSTWS